MILPQPQPAISESPEYKRLYSLLQLRGVSAFRAAVVANAIATEAQLDDLNDLELATILTTFRQVLEAAL
jgi:hypothetical protein